ncbi:hypothetical protein JXL83_06970 [candidate division WOR-3 bacterium]|nr:hypothetical protein [candidate division WOR-3 bacterium]
MNTCIAFEKLNSTDPKIKYGFAKELLKIGADSPEFLYPHFNKLTELLKSENNIFRWTAIDLLGYVSSIDTDNRIDKLIGSLWMFLHSGHLITCNHTIFTLGKIAENKPKHRKIIIGEFLKVSNDKFNTEECKNIAIGKIIDALTPLFLEIRDNKTAIGFVKKATTNTRNSTKKKANQLLKKLRM